MSTWISYTPDIVSDIADFISTPPVLYFFVLGMFYVVIRLIATLLRGV